MEILQRKVEEGWREEEVIAQVYPPTCVLGDSRYGHSARRSSYAHGTRCPVLTSRMVVRDARVDAEQLNRSRVLGTCQAVLGTDRARYCYQGV
eukprot:2481374-Rhodomonas_salina.1